MSFDSDQERAKAEYQNRIERESEGTDSAPAKLETYAFCERCDGTGRIYPRDEFSSKYHEAVYNGIRCGQCEGDGLMQIEDASFIHSVFCRECEGGFVTEKEFKGKYIYVRHQCESCLECHQDEIRADRMMDEAKEGV